MFQSERFFRETWPTISQSVEAPEAAASAVDWIVREAALTPGARVLDAPCGFGRHSVEFARRGYAVTGMDFNETEIARAREAAGKAGVALSLFCQDMRDMEFSGNFDLAVNLFSSIGYFSDDEDRLLLDRFWRALRPDGIFVLDTRNRDEFIRSLAPEYRVDATLRTANSFDPVTSRWHARWLRQEGSGETLIGESDTRLYSAHELRAMLRPERWSRVDLYGGLDGAPFSLDAPRLVFVARK
ncbi:MAG: class I SAM-dependent methyltransferase [Candidatus Rokubacteria bacterium]|nr:class I SAM-dependent methyltransferase [Candidatus Rokubacteria bacterium]